jgi:hypothetical protein
MPFLSGTFSGSVQWSLVRQSSDDYLFKLSGDLLGMLYTSQMVTGTTKQTIDVNQKSWNENHEGKIRTGSTCLGN